jgi:phage-related protein
MGIAVTDTKTAIKQAAAYGLTWEETQKMLPAATGLAVATGKDTASAELMIQQAYAGKGKALEKTTGLKIADYKATDGTINREKLLADLQGKYASSTEAYKNTEAAAVNRAEIAWSRLQTTMGTALLPVVTTVAGAITWVLNLFNNLPDGMKTAIAIGLALSGVFLIIGGAILMIAPGIPVIMDIIVAMGGLSGIMGIATGAVTAFGSAILGFLLTNPVGWLILAVVAIAAIITYFNAWGKVTEWFKGVWKAISDAVMPILMQIYGVYVMVWTGIWTAIQGAWAEIAPALKQLQDALGLTGDGGNILSGVIGFLTGGLNILLAVLKFLAPYVMGVVIFVIKGLAFHLKNIITIITWIVNTSKPAIEAIGGFFKWLATTIGNALQSIWDNTVGKIQPAIDKLKEFLGLKGQAEGTGPSSTTTAAMQGQNVSTNTGMTYENGRLVNKNDPNYKPSAGGQGLGIAEIIAKANSGVVHNHNAPVTIDASHMSELQLKELLIRIYEGAVKG